MRQASLVRLIGVAASLAGALAIALGLQSRHPQVRVVGHPQSVVYVALIGWSFIASGLFAWTRRNKGFGVLMVAAGFAWFAAEFTASNQALLFSLGLLVSSVWIAVFFNALLSFPEGRVATSPARILVVVLYGLSTVGQLAWLLFADSAAVLKCPTCPRNLLKVADEPGLASAILFVQQPVAAVVSLLGGAAVMGRRWLGANRVQRRSLGPVYASGITCLLIVAFVLAVELYWAEVTPVASWISGAAFSAVPAAFLIGVLRQRLDRSVVGEMVVQLAAPEPQADLRDVIAKALRDPTLQLAYWLSSAEQFVDREGNIVRLPSEHSPQIVTYVEHGGERVAALIHAPSLDGGDDLIRAVCAAAALSLANERLQAELRARLQELRASRKRIVAAADAERRRVERDLHDGAQQRLLSVALSLQALEKQIASDSMALRVISEAREELGRTVDELRTLALGIHPATLADYGLVVALEAVVARSAVPTRLTASLEARLPTAVEVACFYVVSEALTNIAKHARATRAEVAIRREDSALVVEICDDGVGGARLGGGTGLLGLSDRVGALDGYLDVRNGPHGGTAIKAIVPCG